MKLRTVERPPLGLRLRLPKLQFRRLPAVLAERKERMAMPPSKRYGKEPRVLSYMSWQGKHGSPRIGVFCWGLDDLFFGRASAIELRYPTSQLLIHAKYMDGRWRPSPIFQRWLAAEKKKPWRSWRMGGPSW